MVLKIYSAEFHKDAKNEFENMRLLDHPNILQVLDLHTVYIEGDNKKE